MFVRFRQSERRLQASLVETRRDGGRVRHAHLASLGSIRLALSVADRMAFWTSLHERLARLDNRLDASARFAILEAVHARVPMVTPEEQQAEQLARAEADARFWMMMDERQDGLIEQAAAMRAGSERMTADANAEKARLSVSVAASRARLARAEAGDTVVAPRPMSAKQMQKALGITQSDLRHFWRLGLLHERNMTSEFVDELRKQARRNEKATSRALLRVLRREGGADT
jgi:hypothetical protein